MLPGTVNKVLITVNTLLIIVNAITLSALGGCGLRRSGIS
nr:MAG TPA_asm: hypothetical protein [Caudoviricetes sp.]